MRSGRRACLGAAATALALLYAPLPAHAQTSGFDALVGHWRKTTIQFAQTRDDHLILGADGSAVAWTVRASGQTPPTHGIWSAVGRTLTLQFQGEQGGSVPFTFYEGQLVLPNIPDRRGFWERIRG